MRKQLKENKGFALAITIMIFGLISILGLAVIGVSMSNLKMVMVDGKSQSAYYIAEAGANKVIDNIGNKVEELSKKVLSHDEFFNKLDEYIKNDLELEIDDFEENYDSIPIAKVLVKDREVGEEENLGAYKKKSVSYKIESLGQIDESKRRISTTIEISHGIEVQENNRHPAFDYVLYGGGNNTINNPGGAKIDGSIYGYNLEFDATGSEIKGDLISEKGIKLKSAVNIDGSIYAMDGRVELSNSNVIMKGDIHASDKVTLSSGSSLEGSVYTRGGVILESSSTKISGDLHAYNDVILNAGTSLEGSLYTVGGIILNSSNASVNGDIHAFKKVQIGAGGRVKNIYTKGDLVFTSSGVIVNGEIHNAGNLEFGPGTHVENIYTNGNVKFASNNTINGQVHSGGIVGYSDSGTSLKVTGDIFSDSDVITRANQNYIINGNIYSKNNITNGAGNRIHGKAISIGIIKNDGTITGQIKGNSSENEILPREYPNTPKSPQEPELEGWKINDKKVPLNTYEIGSADIKGNQNSRSYNIEPGKYNDIILQWNDTLELSSGNYYLNNIKAESSAIKLKLDISNGPINIYAKGNIKFGSGLEVHVSQNGKDFTKIDENFIKGNLEKTKDIAGQLYWETYKDLSLKSSTYFLGTVLINNKFDIGSNSKIVGSYILNSGNMTMGYGPEIIYAPPTSSAAGNDNNGSSTGNDKGINAVPRNIRTIIKNPIREQ